MNTIRDLLLEVQSEINLSLLDGKTEDDDGYDYLVNVIRDTDTSVQQKERLLSIMDTAETYMDGLFGLLQELEPDSIEDT